LLGLQRSPALSSHGAHSTLPEMQEWQFPTLADGENLSRVAQSLDHKGHEGHKGIKVKGVSRVAPERAGSHVVPDEVLATRI
jgi:hypothetical protein